MDACDLAAMHTESELETTRVELVGVLDRLGASASHYLDSVARSSSRMDGTSVAWLHEPAGTGLPNRRFFIGRV
ncbi:MAG: hypothetical protein IPH81_19285 [Candidatus Microthrix sp.]|nr:hypothetical protein [Candidatus Microthrix sp.]